MLLNELESQAKQELNSYTLVNDVLIKTEKIKSIPDIEITLDYIKSKLGRKWRCQLKRMYPVVEWFVNHSNPTMFSTHMLREMRNGKSKSNGWANSSLALNDLISLGLIVCIEEHYNPDNKQAKLYSFNHSNLINLINFIINNNIISSNSTKYSFNSINLLKFNNISNLNYLSMIKDSNYSEEEKEVAELIKKLGLRDLIKIQNDLEPDSQFKYSLGRNALRPYSPFCSLPTKEKEHKIEHPVYREDILDEKMPGWKEFDRIASIYNLNRFIKKGEIAGNNREIDDFYKEFSGCKTKEERVNVKLIMMTLMFGTAQQFNSSANAVVSYYLQKNNRDHQKALKFVERFVAIGRLMGLDSINTHDTVKRMNEWRKEQVKKLESIIGERVGKTIFLYEAFVNLNTEISLKQAGYECKTVYDGFYTNADEATWWELYTQSLIKLFNILNNSQYSFNNSHIISNYNNISYNSHINSYYNYLSMIKDSNRNINRIRKKSLYNYERRIK